MLKKEMEILQIEVNNDGEAIHALPTARNMSNIPICISLDFRSVN